MATRQNHFDVLLGKVRDVVDKYIESEISVWSKRASVNWTIQQKVIDNLRQEIKELKEEVESLKFDSEL